MSNTWQVRRDGEVKAGGFESEGAADAWLLRHQSQSASWAKTHEGWEVRREPVNGYANFETFTVCATYANDATLYFPLLAYARKCLLHVPGMTAGTLGRNAKDALRLWAVGETPGWGTALSRETAAAAARLVEEVGDWSLVSEQEVGADLLETLADGEPR